MLFKYNTYLWPSNHNVNNLSDDTNVTSYQFKKIMENSELVTNEVTSTCTSMDWFDLQSTVLQTFCNSILQLKKTLDAKYQ